MTRLPSIGVTKSQQQTTFHNDKPTIHWSNKNHDKKTTFHNDKATINWNNKNIDNIVPSIMTRLPSIGVTKSNQRTTFKNDKATNHWNNKISTTNFLP